MYRTNISVNSQRWHLSQEIALNSSLKFLKLHFPRRGAIIALIAFLFPAPGPLPAPLLPPAKSNLNEGLSHNYIATFSLLFLYFLRTSCAILCRPKDLYGRRPMVDWRLQFNANGGISGSYQLLSFYRDSVLNDHQCVSTINGNRGPVTVTGSSMYKKEMAQLGAQPVVIYEKTKCLPNPSLLHHYNAHIAIKSKFATKQKGLLFLIFSILKLKGLNNGYKRFLQTFYRAPPLILPSFQRIQGRGAMRCQINVNEGLAAPTDPTNTKCRQIESLSSPLWCWWPGW